MEEEKKESTTKTIQERILEESEKLIEKILENGLEENIDFLYKIVDIRKDVKEEEKNMMYKGYNEGGFGGYSEGGYSEGGFGARGVPGTGRRSYREGGQFGRRGVPGSGRGRYRGEELMEDMAYHYGNYSEGGQYGGEQETLKSLDYMMKSVVQFIGMLEEEAQSPQEIEIIKKYSKKISEM